MIDYVFLNEISDVEEWEKAVNSLRAKGLDVYVSGSNSKLLSGELATYLTGRTVEIKVGPFSAASIRRYLKHGNRAVAFDTVMNYLGFGEEAFLFSAVKREDLMGKQILDVDAEYYVTDHGIRWKTGETALRRDVRIGLL